MAAYEILLLNTAIPQIQAAQSGDTYVVPRDIAFSTVANLANGTNLLPSLTFSSDTNTGIYREGADALGFTAGGGTNQMVLTSTGLGIGTSSPGTKLDVVGAGAVTSGTVYSTIITRQDTTTKRGIFLGYDSSGQIGVIGTDSAGAAASIAFWTYNGSAWGERMRLDSSGNLGLGVTPSAWSSTWKAFQISNRSLAQTGAGAGDLTMVFNGYFDSTDSRWEFQGAGDYAARYSITGAGVHSWHISTAAGANANDPITFTQAMTLDASGNLVVGATSAASILHVRASSATITVDDSGDGTSKISFRPSAASYAERAALSVLYGTGEMRLAAGASGGNFFQTFYTNNTERARITSGGDFLVGSQSGANSRLYVVGASNTSSDLAIRVQDSNAVDMFFVRNDGLITTGTGSGSPYNNTTASAANVYVDSSGFLYRSTSSLKYKTDVQNAVHGLSEVMQLRPVTYKGIGKNDSDTVFGGLIAEEVHAAGLTEFVQYAEDGSPDALAYSNMVSLLVKAIQEQQAMINELKAEVAALKGA